MRVLVNLRALTPFRRGGRAPRRSGLGAVENGASARYGGGKEGGRMTGEGGRADGGRAEKTRERRGVTRMTTSLKEEHKAHLWQPEIRIHNTQEADRGPEEARVGPSVPRVRGEHVGRADDADAVGKVLVHVGGEEELMMSKTKQRGNRKKRWGKREGELTGSIKGERGGKGMGGIQDIESSGRERRLHNVHSAGISREEASRSATLKRRHGETTNLQKSTHYIFLPNITLLISNLRVLSSPTSEHAAVPTVHWYMSAQTSMRQLVASAA
ncbi:hypothetical protein DFH09DRAFT_1427873 [Mycena vulgaris]|nr:hypothetical protein DFH09DRAFT_1427873 [Mycena vulgaris]